MQLKAVKIFKDKEDQAKVYKVGESLNIEDLDRVNDLVSRGLCVITSTESKTSTTKISLFEKEFDLSVVKEALTSMGITLANNAGVTSISKKVSELTEEQSKALSEILCKE